MSRFEGLKYSNWNLGVVYKNGLIINHRSLVKVLFNPILRYFGFQIGTEFECNVIGKPKLAYTKPERIKWKKYDADYDYIIKKRMII